MTQKEIDCEKARRDAQIPFNNINHPIYDDLDCREMINSCLCYTSIDDFWRDQGSGRGSYADPYVKALGLDVVKALVEEQVEDFKKAKVVRNVYTDGEGCTYNNIVWADENPDREI